MFQINCNANGDYPVVVYSTSYINPLENICDISSALKNKKIQPCNILFDLLLSNGNEFNRFAAGYFNGEKINYDTVKIVRINDKSIIADMNKYYYNNPAYLNNSVLTIQQRHQFLKA